MSSKEKAILYGQSNFEVRASLVDLVKLGWNFDWIEDIEKADKQGYFVLLQVENGNTSYTVLSNNNQGGIKEDTGDNEQTIKDILFLEKQDDIWGFRAYY